MPSKKSKANRAKNVSNNDNDHFQNGQQTSKDGEGGIKPKNAHAKAINAHATNVRQILSSDNESPHDGLVNELQDHAMQSQPKAPAVNDKGTGYQDGMTDHKQLTSFISWGRRNPRAMIEQSGKMMAELKKLDNLLMQAQKRQLRRSTSSITSPM